MHDGARALLGRLRRQALVPPWASDVVDVVRRVLAVRAWPSWNTRVAVATRLADPARGTLEQALDAGALVRAYAFRGGSYVMTPAVARTLLAVRTTTRVWETARWQAQGGFALADWAPLREAVREALADGPATRAEIAAHLERSASLRHLAPAAATGAGSDALYKPLHWWSDLAFGPDRDGVSTFRLLSPEPLPATPDVDEAGRRAVLDHLLAYGPATEANLRYWFTEGLGAPWRRVHGWLTDLGDRVREVTVDGAPAWAPSTAVAGGEAGGGTVVLVPGYDPWVLGPGTADSRVVPPARRSLLSAGRHPVLLDGRVVGTWRVAGADVRTEAIDDGVPAEALAAAVARLRVVLDGLDAPSGGTPGR